ncbi:unnamed protein product, partial [Rotaria magnacalcarata]
MSHYHFSTIVSVIIVLVINLTCALTLSSSSPSIKDKLLMKKNDTSLHTYQRASAHVNKMRNITALAH